MLKIALIALILLTLFTVLVGSNSRSLKYEKPKVYLRDGVYYDLQFPYRAELRRCRRWDYYDVFVCTYTVYHEYGHSWGGCHVRTGHSLKCWASMPNYWQIAGE